jgi:hypothetical protein
MINNEKNRGLPPQNKPKASSVITDEALNK